MNENPTFQVYENDVIEATLQTNFLYPQQNISAMQADSFKQIDPETFTMEYRALSKSLIYQQGWRGMIVTDYSEGTVLKKSMPFLQDITIMPDHSFTSGKYLGNIHQTKWTQKVNDIAIPGINVGITFDDDPEASDEHRHLLRGVKKGFLKGFSVSLWLEYKRSHPDLDEWDFYERMGDEIDGEVVRFVATEIKRYLEASVVIAGADPHAQPVQKQSHGAQLMASFSLTHGWTAPEKKAQTIVNNTNQEDIHMKTDTTTVDALTLAENPVVIPESEEADAVQQAEPTVNVNVSSQGFTQEQLDALVEKAKEEERYAAQGEIDELQKTNDKLLQDAHAAELLSFWEGLKKDSNLAASFDELDIVGFMATLSSEVQLDKFKSILQEMAKFATVPVKEVSKDAKQPKNLNQQAQYTAARDEWLKANPGKTLTDAVMALRKTRPELFEEEK